MAYSIDLREKVIDYRKTHAYEETHRTFDVSVTTIIDWETLLEETGSLKKRPLDRKHKKIDPLKLAAYILEFPDAYLQEIADHFECTATAIFYALEKEKITLKKLKFVIVKQMKKNEKLSKKLWRK